MDSYLFWFFSALMLIGGVSVIAFRNPVSSALSVVVSFIGLAGLFVGLSAFFVAVIQILVYSGAVMVLFLFIIMLLDLRPAAIRPGRVLPVVAGLILAVALFFQLAGVLSESGVGHAPPLDAAVFEQAATTFPAESQIATQLRAGRLPDVHLIGFTLFSEYNLPLQILGTLLLVATVGVVVLSKRQESER